MGPPREAEIITADDAAAWEVWLERHHREREHVWVRIAKKGSGVASVTAAEALDLVLCFGWIDGQRRADDATYFLQRYSRRRPRSTWSQVNVDKVAALIADGRMRSAGLDEVAAAQADGRWAAAYASQRTAEVPEDLVDALAADPVARRSFERLGRSERYRRFVPLLTARTAEQRADRLQRVLTGLVADGVRTGATGPEGGA